MGYVRCKLGSESTEYRRGDTIAHVMLQWRNTGGADFSCGVCIEAYRDNRFNEHFWIGDAVAIKDINVCNEKKEPLLFRQFKNPLNISDCPTKREYTRNLTNRLGVYKRQAK